MNCNFCNAQLNDDALVCSDCGDRIAERAQAKKIDDLKKNLTSIFSTNFKSTFALILAIAMSVIALCNFVIGISNLTDILGFGISVLIGVVALIDAIGIWKLWSSNAELDPKSVNAFKGYVSLQKTLNTIALVIFEIFGAILLILSIGLMIAIDSIGDGLNEITGELGELIGGEAVVAISMIQKVVAMGPAILLVVAIILIVAVTVYFVLLNRAFKKIIKYVKHLSTSIEYSTYKTTEKPPYVSLFIFGGLSVICSLASGILGLLSGLAFGAYLIVTALLFKNIHEEAQKHNASIEAEAAILEDITRRTDLYIAQTVAAKRAAQQENTAPTEAVAE